MKRIDKFLVRYILFKPLCKLDYIVNGKIIGPIRWYQRPFSVRWRLLHHITYELAKFVM